MELKLDALQLLWSIIPALVMVVLGSAQLAHVIRQRKSVARSFNTYSGQFDTTMRSER